MTAAPLARYSVAVPPAKDSKDSPEQALQRVVDRVGRFDADAYLFVQAALHHTATAIHGRREPAAEGVDADAAESPTRHISGAQLCEGIRDFALARWGRMAATVLGHWGVRETLDFGRIVFALVDAGLMSKTDDDALGDFEGVFDLRRALEHDYALPARLLDPDADPADPACPKK